MQFTVYRNADNATCKVVPFLLDIQSDLIEKFQTCVVVPLISPARAGTPLTRLMPLLEVDGESWVMDTPQLAGVPRRTLGQPVAELSSQRSTIMMALDMLISGI